MAAAHRAGLRRLAMLAREHAAHQVSAPGQRGAGV
jgi:hypothetical protein